MSLVTQQLLILEFAQTTQSVNNFSHNQFQLSLLKRWLGKKRELKTKHHTKAEIIWVHTWEAGELINLGPSETLPWKVHKN